MENCPACDKSLKHLHVHLKNAHGWTAEEVTQYRKIMGLKTGSDDDVKDGKGTEAEAVPTKLQIKGRGAGSLNQEAEEYECRQLTYEEMEGKMEGELERAIEMMIHKHFAYLKEQIRRSFNYMDEELNTILSKGEDLKNDGPSSRVSSLLHPSYFHILGIIDSEMFELIRRAKIVA